MEILDKISMRNISKLTSTEESVTDLTMETKEYTRKLGADIVGIAPVKRFQGAPEGHRPTDLMKSASSVVAFGIRNLRPVVDSSPSYAYSKMGYYFLNRYLDRIAYDLGRFLDDRGFAALPLGAAQALRFVNTSEPGSPRGRFWGVFSLKHAAEQAGLGHIGKNTLLITPRYGPRVRLGALITDAPLDADPLLKEVVCYPKCNICVEGCPEKALTDRDHFDHVLCFMEGKERTALNKKRLQAIKEAMKGDITAFDARAVSAADYVGRTCGLYCIKVCPVGKRNAT